MIFTFGFGHECLCGRSLRWCFTEIDGDWETAREHMFKAWGAKWAHQYESEEEAGFANYLVPAIRVVTSTDPARCPCGGKAIMSNILDNEPKITINGKPLTPPEALSVRLAVDNWAAELALNPHALGEDEHGHKMRENYLGHLHRVLHAMLEP
ncbi:MAG TPA: hypothetical protein VK524_34490 [Polyangiaceae bacterium]|nr:hypothetical protein [Polyangiaceae bacterium]